MVVKTKRYKLESGTYIKLALANILRKQWWVALIVIGLCSGYFILPNIWWFIGTGIALVLYFLFWLIQFAGVTQMDQTKILFDRLIYEISSQQILIKLSSKQGMPIKWEQVRSARVTKKSMIIVINTAQMIYLPFSVFRTENERKFVETILKRKGYIS